MFTTCDPRRRMRSDSNPVPKSNAQFSTLPAFHWYPSGDNIGGRLTDGLWLFTNGRGRAPAVSIGGFFKGRGQLETDLPRASSIAHHARARRFPTEPGSPNSQRPPSLAG